MTEVRLQKFLAAAGLCSRRGAKDLMRQGRVAVDGVPAEDVCRVFDPDLSTVTLDGQVVSSAQKLAYYLFHKPTGYLTSLADPQGRPTVRPFLERLPVRVFPVGRLDMDVSGVLILTNDGELSRRLMHPSYLVPKVYLVRVNGVPDETDLERLRNGSLIIEDKPAAPAKARMLKSGPAKGWLELILTEGRNRQVKRMCAAIGHRVIELKRVAYCDLWLPDSLAVGSIVKLNKREINILKKKVGL
ncbi:MAG: rRNA pseudouridine synthase [Deltaproteobacteria bacterium]|jgi:pseudouridine synthase|nr:rRNA pseudouridine synthase [Deltaproteobacteria bacterium]